MTWAAFDLLESAIYRAVTGAGPDRCGTYCLHVAPTGTTHVGALRHPSRHLQYLSTCPLIPAFFPRLLAFAFLCSHHRVPPGRVLEALRSSQVYI
jgi:hypothetical protein